MTESQDNLRFVPATPAWRTAVQGVGLRAVTRMAAVLNGVFGSRSQGRVGILTYHGVSPPEPGVMYSPMNVPPDWFREQLTGLLSRGFTFWPLRRVLDHHRGGEPVPPGVIVVTFDDGFESVYRHAWPVIRELQIPATIFLNTAYLDSDEPFPFDPWGTATRDQAAPETYRPLTTAQCRELSDTGLIELGAHTHTHEDFRRRPDELTADLRLNLEELRERFGLADATFAFPYGSRRRGFAGHELVEAARRSGVLCALSTESELVDHRRDPFLWGRQHVFYWDSSAMLAAKLSGWYGWARRQYFQVAGEPRPREVVTSA